MSAEKKIFMLEPREAKACRICQAKNTDTRTIRIDTEKGEAITSFPVCRPCLKKLALNIAVAWFDFSETAQASTPEPKT